MHVDYFNFRSKILYSYCAGTDFYPSLSNDLVMFKVFAACTVPSLVAEMLIHVAIFVKQREIEKRANVYEIRGDQLVARQRHQGSVQQSWITSQFVFQCCNLSHVLYSHLNLSILRCSNRE